MSTGGGIGGQTPGSGCEEALARARMQLDDLNNFNAASEAEVLRLAAEYRVLGGQISAGGGVGSPTGGATPTPPATAPTATAPTATAPTGGEGTRVSEVRSGGPSVTILLQRRSASLSERLARLEARQ